jgi:hypothetical protein
MVKEPLPSSSLMVRTAVSVRQSLPGTGAMLVSVTVDSAPPNRATVPSPQNTIDGGLIGQLL